MGLDMPLLFLLLLMLSMLLLTMLPQLSRSPLLTMQPNQLTLMSLLPTPTPMLLLCLLILLLLIPWLLMLQLLLLDITLVQLAKFPTSLSPSHTRENTEAPLSPRLLVLLLLL